MDDILKKDNLSDYQKKWCNRFAFCLDFIEQCICHMEGRLTGNSDSRFASDELNAVCLQNGIGLVGGTLSEFAGV